jgi:hypothetical protein
MNLRGKKSPSLRRTLPPGKISTLRGALVEVVLVAAGRALRLRAMLARTFHPFSCCMTAGVALHSSPVIGFDMQVTVVESGLAPSAGDYIADQTASAPYRFSIAKLHDVGILTNQMVGTVRVFGASSANRPPALGLCLRVNEPASVFAGTIGYVSRVSLSSYNDDKRFQIFRLLDPNIAPAVAAASPLSSLVLAATPWLGLSALVSVEQSSGIVELATGHASGDSLRSALSSIPVSGSPFVVTVDGSPIYLGAFWRSFSGMRPDVPVIVVDEITNTQFKIVASMQGTTDPRFDARVVQVLTETGKLLP